MAVFCGHLGCSRVQGFGLHEVYRDEDCRSVHVLASFWDPVNSVVWSRVFTRGFIGAMGLRV